jgi:hypothetical protein
MYAWIFFLPACLLLPMFVASYLLLTEKDVF